MLIQFSVGNYRSFRDVSTFSFVASKLRSPDKALDTDNVVRVRDDLGVLRTAAIYGANASGKSNFVRALHFMKVFVANSSKESQAGESIPIEPFRLSPETRLKPSRFEIVFIANKTQYRYGFELTGNEVVSEWLHYVPEERETMLFQRHGSEVNTNRSGFKESDGLVTKTRSNALFLSVCAQFNGPVSTMLLEWFRKLRVLMGPLYVDRLRDYTARGISKGTKREQLVALLQGFDLGISDLHVDITQYSAASIPKEMPDELRSFLLKNASDHSVISTEHVVMDSSGNAVGKEIFDLENNESDGTQKLFALGLPLLEALESGYVMVVDELDARLHPLLTLGLVQLFQRSQPNRRAAQLLFTTHDVTLLSNRVFRRDQVWFAEKHGTGSTELYSLAEFKVRKDARFDVDYMHGRYGGIPMLNRLQSIDFESNEK